MREYTKLEPVDVVVVGAGIAAYSMLQTIDKGTRVAHFASSFTEISSWWSAGGIAAPALVGDSVDAHVRDTLFAGGGLCDPLAVATIVEEAGDAIGFLEKHGVVFGGRGREGGHSVARVLHANGDRTGAAIMVKLVQRLGHLRSFEAQLAAIAVAGNRVVGVWILRKNALFFQPAKSVVLATGGATSLWKHHTTPPGNLGSPIVSAFRAGAKLASLELIQFHPTAIDSTKVPHPLATEALRGAGALLVDEANRRFVFDFDSRGELATRDIVARAIAERRRHGPVYLDARLIGRSKLESDFPAFCESCRSLGIDPAEHLVPVRSAAHYFIGGVVTDLNGRTSVPGLYAVGECASTGLHGANRLASNSLLEGVVIGRRVASAIRSDDLSLAEPEPYTTVRTGPSIPAVAEILEKYAGPVRDAAGLLAGLKELRSIRQRDMEPSDARAATDAALLAELVLRSCAFRKESIGAHFRADASAAEPRRVPVICGGDLLPHYAASTDWGQSAG